MHLPLTPSVRQMSLKQSAMPFHTQLDTHIIDSN